MVNDCKHFVQIAFFVFVNDHSIENLFYFFDKGFMNFQTNAHLSSDFQKEIISVERLGIALVIDHFVLENNDEENYHQIGEI